MYYRDVVRVTDRQINEMLGMLRGIVCDGVVTEGEVRGFRNWLAENPWCAKEFPGNVLAARLERVIDNGTIAPGDRAELYELFCDTLGQGDLSKGPQPTYSTRLPLDDPAPPITFAGNRFCLTGRFMYGERKDCAAAIEARGGTYGDSILRTSPMTLVIGDLGNVEWMYSAYGRKIESAMAYRANGAHIAIVCEEHWANAIMSTPPMPT